MRDTMSWEATQHTVLRRARPYQVPVEAAVRPRDAPARHLYPGAESRAHPPAQHVRRDPGQCILAPVGFANLPSCQFGCCPQVLPAARSLRVCQDSCARTAPDLVPLVAWRAHLGLGCLNDGLDRVVAWAACVVEYNAHIYRGQDAVLTGVDLGTG